MEEMVRTRKMQHLGAGTLIQHPASGQYKTLACDRPGVATIDDQVFVAGQWWNLIKLERSTLAITTELHARDRATYIYQADVYCESCALAIRRQLQQDGILADRRQKYGNDAVLADETTYDSDDYPKGPFSNNPNMSNFTGYADTEQYCAACHKPLYHPLAFS